MRLQYEGDFLDPDIAGLVEWLNANGFVTTDSGDGHSKLEGAGSYDDPDCLRVPHVAIASTPDTLRADADRLQLLLATSGVAESTLERFWQIEATYYPAGNGALILLTGLLTADVPVIALGEGQDPLETVT